MLLAFVLGQVEAEFEPMGADTSRSSRAFEPGMEVLQESEDQQKRVYFGYPIHTALGFRGASTILLMFLTKAPSRTRQETRKDRRSSGLVSPAFGRTNQRAWGEFQCISDSRDGPERW